MFDFHKDKSAYFQQQYSNSRDYIIPFVEPFMDLDEELKVLEIGSAEAGVLKAFVDRGHLCTGIELSPHRVEKAKGFMQEEMEKGRISFLARNIYDIDTEKDLYYKYDLIILKDVIEHIHDQKRFMKKLKGFLAPRGKVFFGFPPWQMPFGGHQQMCKSKVGSALPYYHLLPVPLYRGVLKMLGETDIKIANLLEIKETGISTERFERIAKEEGFGITKRQLFFINPIYKYKFNLKPRKQTPIITGIPFVRNFLSTCAYYLIEKNE